jgi:hypothetical protein
MADAVQPENHGAWKSATKDLLGNAKGVTSELFAALSDKEFARPDSPKVFASGLAPFVDLGPRNKAELDEKLAVTRHADNLVDTACQHTGQIVQHLKHERQKKWATLKVCEWRLALRAHRPPQELFKDHVQDALDGELKALTESREKLVKLVEQGKDILEDCEANKHRLMRNIHLMVQMGTARNLPPLVKSAPSNGPPSPTAEPSSPTGPAPAEGDDAEPASPKNKPVVPSDPAGLLKRAPQIAEIVRAFVAKGSKTIKEQRRICDAANEKVVACLQKRWSENEVLKKNLEQQIADMGEAIYNAEKSLSRMKKRIVHFNEVDLQPKYDAAQAILEKLRASKTELEDDFHRKIISMKIDESCRKITPERTGENPNKMPVTGMMELLATKKLGRTKSGMNRTSSSPALLSDTGNATIKPDSPAGASSPLKAAAAASMA